MRNSPRAEHYRPPACATILKAQPSFSAKQEVRQRRTQSQVEPPKRLLANRLWRVAAARGANDVTLIGWALSWLLKRNQLFEVALATDVRSATVSNNRHLMNASDEGSNAGRYGRGARAARASAALATSRYRQRRLV